MAERAPRSSLTFPGYATRLAAVERGLAWVAGARQLRAMTVQRYLIIIEPTRTGYSAHAPDLPGCVSTGRTRDEVHANMREAIAFHLDGLRLEGLSAPEPSTESAYVDIAA